MRIQIKRSCTSLVRLLAASILFVGSLAPVPPAAAQQPGPIITVDNVLSWLPADTETVIVSQASIRLKDEIRRAARDRSTALSPQDLKDQFFALAAGMIGIKDDVLAKHLVDSKVLLAVEGSRHFRSPSGLGEMPYEGCQILVFAEDMTAHAEAFWKSSAAAAKLESIQGTRVAVLQQKMEQDLWTYYVAFPRSNVVTIATNRDYLSEVLARMKGARGPRALPGNLPEWKNLDRNAPFWGLRHYDRSQSEVDPSSPFGGEKSGNFPDEEAVGLAFQFDPARGREAVVTYVTGPTKTAQDVLNGLFPAQAESEWKALHPRCRMKAPGVAMCSFELAGSEPAGLFFFLLMGILGHGVWL